MQNFRFTLSLCTAALAVAACSGASSPSLPAAGKAAAFLRGPSASSPIKHIVLIIQENRTFNDLFATFPGAVGTTVGKKLVNNKAKSIDLTEVNLAGQRNLNHNYHGYQTAYDGGKMDAFNQVRFPSNNKEENAAPYEYVNPSQVAPYWAMAQQYALADEMFTTQGSASFTAHQDLIRGGTAIDSGDSLIDNPPYGKAWGCDSAPGTTTTLITTGLQYKRNAGPYPCSNEFPGSGAGYLTLRDLLDAQSVTWKYYTPKVGDTGAIWNAFDVIAARAQRSRMGHQRHVAGDQRLQRHRQRHAAVNVVGGARRPQLGSSQRRLRHRAVVGRRASSMPSARANTGTPRQSSWCGTTGADSTTPSPRRRSTIRADRGFRVPMIVVSPYARENTPSRPGYISNTVYEFGSIVRFVEDTFDLGRLGTTDVSSNAMDDMFDFGQSPRQFQPIGSKYSRSYFLHRRPSGQPVDSE